MKGARCDESVKDLFEEQDKTEGFEYDPKVFLANYVADLWPAHETAAGESLALLDEDAKTSYEELDASMAS